MTLIKSISGIRGTIGGNTGENLTPPDITQLVVAYTAMIKEKFPGKKLKVVIGRDARVSGEALASMVKGVLALCGIDVVDAGLATTPTVEMAVTASQSDGGIILTASHNPAEWNALKLLNERGEFISAEDGNRLLQLIEQKTFLFPGVNDLGNISGQDFLEYHINSIVNHSLVDKEAIEQSGFRIVVDPVNSVGSIAVPALLKSLGVKEVIMINGEPNGRFNHNPEPLPEHLKDLSMAVKQHKAHLGISVDPDVDRLALVCEDGSMFGEEYTLVAVADYVLQHRKGPAVSNLSSSQALKDIALKHGCEYYSAAVGEVNVVKKMKETGAVIGGEGNGGVILPDLHYGRDALAGIALFLSYLAKLPSRSMIELKNSYPSYVMIKDKIPLGSLSFDGILKDKIKNSFSQATFNEEDGLKIILENSKQWIHIRPSNTEPILRIYAEGPDEMSLKKLLDEFKNLLNT